MQAEEIRTQQRQTWDRFSAGWVKWDELVMNWLAPACDVMVAGIAPKPDAEHLDVATGTGEPGLTIAGIARDGHVVLSDLSMGMLDGARRGAADRGLRNVDFREADASALPFADKSFDSVSCRFGFMFFPDMAAAAHEFARVLRPGGVVSAAVWAGPDANPWAAIAMAEIGRVVDLPTPPPGAPGLFRCATPGFVTSLFDDAGLEVLGDEDVAVVARAEPPERFWDYLSEVAAPVVAGLALADDEGRAQIRTATLAAMASFVVDGRMEAPGLARVTTARKS